MRPSPPSYPGAWDLQRDAFYERIGAYGTALGASARLAEGTPAWPAGSPEMPRG